jgi:hypothetical protein
MCRTQVSITVSKVFLTINCPKCIKDKCNFSVFTCGHWTCIDCTHAPQVLTKMESFKIEMQSNLTRGLKIIQNLGRLTISGLIVFTLPSGIALGLISVVIDLICNTRQKTFLLENHQVKWSWNQYHKGWILMTKENDGSSLPWQGWSKPPQAMGARELHWDNRNYHWICW